MLQLMAAVPAPPVASPRWVLIVAVLVIVFLAVRAARRSRHFDQQRYDHRLCRHCGMTQPGHAAYCRHCGKDL